MFVLDNNTQTRRDDLSEKIKLDKIMIRRQPKFEAFFGISYENFH